MKKEKQEIRNQEIFMKFISNDPTNEFIKYLADSYNLKPNTIMKIVDKES